MYNSAQSVPVRTEIDESEGGAELKETKLEQNQTTVAARVAFYYKLKSKYY